MKLISKASILGLGIISSSAFANGYQTQLHLDYLDDGNVDAVFLSGSYFIENVNTAYTPWGEAAFMGRKSNINASYSDVNGNLDPNATSIGFEFMGDTNNNLYAALSYTNVDSILGSNDEIRGEIGYFLTENWLMSVATSDADNAPIELNTKYVASLGGGQFFNVEANINDDQKELTVSGDYYFKPQSSIGLELSQAEGFNYGVSLQHFFNESFAVKVAYISLDSDDVANVGITARF